MHLTDAQVREFHRAGFLLLPEVFSPHEVDILKAELPAVFAAHGPAIIREKDGRSVRSVYGSHVTNDVFRQLTRHPRLLLPASRLLDGSVYVHQFKINAKVAFGGDQWEWHQDYIFWRNEDRMPTARVVNVAVFLDDVTEFNGPILFIPGSHLEGVIEPGNGSAASSARDAPKSSTGPAWMSHVGTSLKYALGLETVRDLAARRGIHAPKGLAGSILLFDANLVHASAPNLSPWDRSVAFVTFNSTENRLPDSSEPRPEFLASRDFCALSPVPDGVWSDLPAVGV